MPLHSLNQLQSTNFEKDKEASCSLYKVRIKITSIWEEILNCISSYNYKSDEFLYPSDDSIGLTDLPRLLEIMGLRDIKLDPHLTLTCLLLFLVIPSPVVSVTLLSNKGETSFLGNGTSSVTSTVDVPIVNKCCPLGERWTSGACVKSPPLSRIVRRSTPESEIETLEEQSSEHDANSSSHGFTDPDLPVAFR